MPRFALCSVLLFGLAGCGSGPSPTTKKELEKPTKAFVAMADPSIESYIVRDISDSLESGSWRWTYDKPELRLMVGKPENLKVEFDFVIADATFKTTGPVTVSFFVDGKPVGTKKCDKAGDYQYTAPVPAGWLKENSLANVSAEVKPLWTSPTDGKRLGLILVKAGFVS